MLLVLYAGLTLLKKARLSQKVNQVLNLPIQVDSRYWIGGNWVAVGAFLPDPAATGKPLRVGPRRK